MHEPPKSVKHEDELVSANGLLQDPPFQEELWYVVDFALERVDRSITFPS
jgi:hypothetical protein